MAGKENSQSRDRANSQRLPPKSASENRHPPSHQPAHPSTLIRRAKLYPNSLTPSEALQLQQTIGNRAFQHLLGERHRPQAGTGEARPPTSTPSAMHTRGGTDSQTHPHAPGPGEAPFNLPLEPPAGGAVQQAVREEQQASSVAPDVSAGGVRQENRTGMPEQLKSGLERLSGLDLSGVSVNYNSPKPARFNSHAYARGKEIEVARGQEKHLAHEGWHVVQQMQGRVRPTSDAEGAALNSDPALEHEADVMGDRASRAGGAGLPGDEVGAGGSDESPPGLNAGGGAGRRDPAAYAGRVAAPVMQLKTYNELSDLDKEAVDRQAEEEFISRRDEFELQLGIVASRDRRAASVADELLERTVLLAETVFFNEEEELKGKDDLDNFFKSVFGTENPGVTGGVGANPEDIRSVFSTGGTFREKMSMFYVALETAPPHRSPLDKLLFKYSEFLQQEFVPVLKGDKDKAAQFDYSGSESEVWQERRPPTTWYDWQGLVPYVSEREKKEYLKRALSLAKLEIDIERRAERLSRGKVSTEQLEPDEALARQREDEETSVLAVDMATGGRLTGREVSDSAVTVKIRKAVEQLMRKGLNNADEVAKHKATLTAPMDEHLARLRKKFGLYEMLAKRAVAADTDLKKRIGELVKKGARNLEAEALEAAVARHAAELMYEAANKPSPENLAAADAVTRATAVLDKLAQKVEEETKAEDEGRVTENFAEKVAEKMAERRFNELELYDASHFGLKRPVNESRKGDSRKDDKPVEERVTEATPRSLIAMDPDALSQAPTLRELRFAFSRFKLDKLSDEQELRLLQEFLDKKGKAGEDELSEPERRELALLRELERTINTDAMSLEDIGKTFFKLEELRRLRQEFIDAKEASKGKRTRLNKDEEEEFRQHLLGQVRSRKVMDARLPWMPGGAFWRINPKSPFKQVADELRVKVAATVSGTTDRVMRGATYLNMSGAEHFKNLLLACLGWMIPAGDHTYYEILKAAEPYLAKNGVGRKRERPERELSIDVAFAFGKGYRRFFELFPDYEESLESPDYYLSDEYKDELAEQIKSPQEKNDATLKIISSAGKESKVNQEVTYSLRAAPEDWRFEWFWIRHDDGKARANRGGTGAAWKKSWAYEGLYKIYCTIHNTKLEGEPLVATLRFDQVVYPLAAPAPKGGAKATPTATSVTPTETGARSAEHRGRVDCVITFTDWNGRTRPLPCRVSASAIDVEGTRWRCDLSVPDHLGATGATFQTYTGEASLPQRLTEPTGGGGSEVVSLFNRYFRRNRPQDVPLAQAEAAIDAIKNWQQAQTYNVPGSVNIDVIDTDTQVVLREHYFYVMRGGEGESSRARVPAYRIQGGDYQLGIKSSVRLVNARDGSLDISGDAMVWVNFADQARMVWWLNNRSDRSYAVTFQVSGDYLRKIAGRSVVEEEANAEGNRDKPYPIISADRAAHQYAIRRHDDPGFASLEEMRKKAVGGMFKAFQWKTFDIGTTAVGETPEGGGILAQPFNETMRRAAELKLKIRFLEQTGDLGLIGEQLKEMRVRQASLEAAGLREWREDYYNNLRKPGATQVSPQSRKLYSELTEDEKGKYRKEFVEKVGRNLNAVASRLIELLSDKISALTEESFAEHQPLVDSYVRAILKLAMDNDIYSQLGEDERLGMYRDALFERLSSRLKKKMPRGLLDLDKGRVDSVSKLGGEKSDAPSADKDLEGLFAEANRRLADEIQTAREYIAGAKSDKDLQRIDGLDAKYKELEQYLSKASARDLREVNAHLNKVLAINALFREKPKETGRSLTAYQRNIVARLDTLLGDKSEAEPVKKVNSLPPPDLETGRGKESPPQAKPLPDITSGLNALRGYADRILRDWVAAPVRRANFTDPVPVEKVARIVSNLTGALLVEVDRNAKSLDSHDKKIAGLQNIVRSAASYARSLKAELGKVALAPYKSSGAPRYSERNEKVRRAFRSAPQALDSMVESLEKLAGKVGAERSFVRGKVTHVWNSCYVAVLIHMFASDPAFERLLDPDKHRIVRKDQSEESRRERKMGRAIQRSNLRQMVADLRNPDATVSGEAVTTFIQFLDANGFLTPLEEVERRTVSVLKKSGVETATKAPSSETPSVKEQEKQTGKSEPQSLVRLQQDAAEVLQRLMSYLQPVGGLTIEEQAMHRREEDPAYTASGTAMAQPVLQLPITGEVNTLEQALINYTRAEWVEDVATYRRLQFKRMPNVLTIALRRFDFDRNTGRKVKIDKSVTAPDILTIPAEALHPDIAGRTFSYRLSHFIFHSGGIGGGHYTAYSRNEKNEWVLNDDISGPTIPSTRNLLASKNTAYIYTYKLIQ